VNRTLSQINEEYDEDDLSGLLSNKPHTPNTNKRGKSNGSNSPRSASRVQRYLSLSMTNKSDI
jgi:hypothetical protein